MDLEIKKKEICLQFEKKVAERCDTKIGKLFYRSRYPSRSTMLWLGFELSKEEDDDYYLLFKYLDLKTCKVYLDEVYISRKFVIFENLYDENKVKIVIESGLELVCKFIKTRMYETIY